MFLHIGGDLVLPFRSIISIHDIRIFSDASNRAYLEQMKNKAPLIEVKSGTSFIVTFEGSEQ